MTPLVCRRVEDTDGTGTAPRGACPECGKEIYIAGEPEPNICIHCVVKTQPGLVLFVALPPDEFGGRSLAKSVAEVYARDGGEWHKHGIWYNQKDVLNQ